MEWSRAKTILIYVFLALNIFLLLQFGQHRLGEGVSRQTLENTRKILESRGVTFAEGVEIPAYSKRTPMLEFKNRGIDASEITGRLLGTHSSDVSENSGGSTEIGTKTVEKDGFVLTYRDTAPIPAVNLQDEEAVKGYLLEFCSNAGIKIENFVMDILEYNGNLLKVLFTQKIKDLLVFDNYILFELENGGVSFMQYSYMDVKGLGKTSREMEILPAYMVLLKAFPKESNAVIESIDLGFKGYTSPKNREDENVLSDSQSPVWRIIVRGDTEPRFFKAYDGEELTFSQVSFCLKKLAPVCVK